MGKFYFKERNMFSTLSLDSSCFTGLISEILDFASIRGATISNLAHHLAFFGASLDRYPYAELRKKVYPALNILLSGEPATGKGESLALFFQLYDFDKHAQYLLAPFRLISLTSGKNAVKYIHDVLTEYEGDDGNKETRILIINEEFAGQLGCLSLPTNKLSSVLINLIDGTPLSETYGKKKIDLPPVHFSSINHVPPSICSKSMKARLINTGLPSRYTFLGVPEPKFSSKIDNYSVPELEDIRNKITSSLSKGSERAKVDLSVQAKDCYIAYYKECFEYKPDNENLRHLTVRFPEQCLKIALILALTNQEQEISLSSMEAAQAVMRYSKATLEELFSPAGASSPERIVKEFFAEKKIATKSEITIALSKQIPVEKINSVLAELETKGVLSREVSVGLRGRHKTTFTLKEKIEAA